MTEQPYPVGTKVRYHGSHPDYHGVYEITAQQTERFGVKVTDIPEYTDNVCYDLWPEGVEHTYRNRELALYFVRRASITPVE